MADEAVLITETELPLMFTVADGTGIEKGALLKLSDPSTVALSSALTDRVGGIAAAEKIANDGQTKLAVFRQGIFKVKASGSITAGDPVGFATSTGDNTVRSIAATANLSGSCCLGTALETAATNETLLIELNPQTIKSA